MLSRYRCQLPSIRHFHLRIGDGFEKDTPCIFINQRLDRLSPGEIGKTKFDSQIRQRFGKQRIGIAKNFSGCDDILTLSGNGNQ